jgi:hypothetical protein
MNLPHRSACLAAAAAALVSIASLAPPATSQSGPLPPPDTTNTIPEGLRLQYNLWLANRYARQIGVSHPGLLDSLAQLGLQVAVNPPVVRVLVEVFGDSASGPVSPGLVSLHGGTIDATWEWFSDCWIPVDTLVAFAGATPADFVVNGAQAPNVSRPFGREPPVVTAAVSSGVLDIIRAQNYHAAKIKGDGVKIAVIDDGFFGLAEARANGDGPAEAKVEHAPEDLGESTHGTLCLEILHDIVPDATYRLYRTKGRASWAQAIQDAIDNGVKIVSHSMGFYEDWEDCAGIVCKAARAAAAANVLLFTAAGNERLRHFEATFTDANDDRWHDMPDGTPVIPIWVPQGGNIDVQVRWESHFFNKCDLDLYLWKWGRVDVGVDGYYEVRKSAVDNRLDLAESLVWKNPQGANGSVVYLAVHKRSGRDAKFELFVEGSGHMQLHHIVAGSTASPSCAPYAAVVPIGAVRAACYATGQGEGCDAVTATDPLEPFSSIGPTNEGRSSVVMVAPDSLLTFTGGYFEGTSCATPVAAGAAALMMCLEPDRDPLHLVEGMEAWAITYKDWGEVGSDHVYGFGGVMFPGIKIKPKGRTSISPSQPTRVDITLLGTASLPMDSVAHGEVRFEVDGIVYAQSAPWLLADADDDGRVDATYYFDLSPSTPTGVHHPVLSGAYARTLIRWVATEELELVHPTDAVTVAPRAAVIRVEPNPARRLATFHVEAPGLGSGGLEIVDLQGRRIWHQAAPRTALVAWRQQVSLRGLSPGVYGVRYRDREVTLEQRLIVLP